MRTLTIRAGAPASFVAALVLSLSGCGGDDYDEDLVKALQAQGASQEEAECFIDELGEKEAKSFVALGDEAPDPDDVEKYLAALEECGVEPSGG